MLLTRIGYCWKCNSYLFGRSIEPHMFAVGKFSARCHLETFTCQNCFLMHAGIADLRRCSLYVEYVAIWQGYTCQETINQIMRTCNLNYFFLANICQKSDKTAQRWMRQGIPKTGFDWQGISDYLKKEILQVQESDVTALASLEKHRV